MKKVVLLAALLGGASFAGNVATHEVKTAAIKKSLVATTPISNPSGIRYLCSITFNCAEGGYSVECYGSTCAEAAAVYKFYAEHLDC